MTSLFVVCNLSLCIEVGGKSKESTTSSFCAAISTCGKWA